MFIAKSSEWGKIDSCRWLKIVLIWSLAQWFSPSLCRTVTVTVEKENIQNQNVCRVFNTVWWEQQIFAKLIQLYVKFQYFSSFGHIHFACFGFFSSFSSLFSIVLCCLFSFLFFQIWRRFVLFYDLVGVFSLFHFFFFFLSSYDEKSKVPNSISWVQFLVRQI